jgi:hypothetical protein
LEGTVFNYCNIQAREHPENMKEKIKAGLYGGRKL